MRVAGRVALGIGVLGAVALAATPDAFGEELPEGTLTATAAPGSVPLIDVLTMGPGDDIFSHFGHSAICVTDARSPTTSGSEDGRCYNYGTADFSTPVPLTWEFIRGRAKFWVSVADERNMLGWYEREDRTIWRQRLRLPAAEANELARRLEEGTAEAVRYYRYHHFEDNCTTRIRDLVDRVTGGKLSAGTKSVADGPSFREYAKRGFAGDAPLLVAAIVVLGRSSDRPTTTWQGMFLPERFRDAVEAKLGAKPEVLYRRRAPFEPRSTALGDWLLAGIGAALGVVALLGAAVGPRAARIARVPAGLVLGLAGLVLWTLAILTAFSELRVNEVLLVLLPTDLVLVFLRGAWLRRVLAVRLVGLGLVGVLALVGVLVQPLLSPLVMVALPLGVIFVVVRRAPPS